jgi:threonine dehydrogenase-like Zn-dependent dehydrogenase
MRAAVFHDVGDVRIEDVPDPTPGHGDVVVEVAACGICGSDLEYHAGRTPLGTADGRGPLILGHELAGRVVALGPGVSGLAAGDRVAVNPIQSRAASDAARAGSPQFDLATVLGVSVDGGFAQYVRTRAEHAYRLPDELSDEQGAFVEMLAASLHAVEKADIRFGDHVVIYGPGPVGLSMIALAVARGATVTVVGTRDYRLELAQDLGARHVLNPADEGSPHHVADVPEAIRAANGGALADRALVATSAPAAAREALEVTGDGAVVVFMGLAGPGDAVELPLLSTLVAEKTIRFSWLYPHQWPKTIRALRDRIVDVEPLITHQAPLTDFCAAIARVENREDSVIKLMIRP